MTLHAVHREPWCADCPECLRSVADPGIPDAELWPCPCQSEWRKPRPLWRRLLGWLNDRLGIVETDPVMNAYYDRVDREIDARRRMR